MPTIHSLWSNFDIITWVDFEKLRMGAHGEKRSMKYCFASFDCYILVSSPCPGIVEPQPCHRSPHRRRLPRRNFAWTCVGERLAIYEDAIALWWAGQLFKCDVTSDIHPCISALNVERWWICLIRDLKTHAMILDLSIVEGCWIPSIQVLKGIVLAIVVHKVLIVSTSRPMGIMLMNAILVWPSKSDVLLDGPVMKKW